MSNWRSSANQIKEWLRDSWTTFRAHSGYYQLKVLIVALNIICLIGAYIVFWPPSFDFSYSIVKSELVFSETRVVEVNNLSDDVFFDVDVTAVGGGKRYTHRLRRIDAMSSKRLEQSVFRDVEDRSPPAVFVIDAVELTKDGDPLSAVEQQKTTAP